MSYAIRCSVSYNIQIFMTPLSYNEQAEVTRLVELSELPSGIRLWMDITYI